MKRHYVNIISSIVGGTTEYRGIGAIDISKFLDLDVSDVIDIFGDGSCYAFYKMDGDVTDATGDHNGYSSTVTFENGRFGLSAKSAGTDKAYLGIFNYNTPCSMSLWTKGEFSLSNGLNGSAYQTFGLTHWGLSCWQYNGATSGLQSVSYAADFNFIDFTHIVVTINYPSMKIYVNGILFNAITMACNVGASSYATGIFDSSNHSNSYTGNMDHLRFFNRDIDAYEVELLFKEDRKLFIPTKA